jgi:hypothetical protein
MQIRNSFFLAALVAFTTFFTACNREEITNSDEYADYSIQQIEERTRTGRGGCFELVFPVSIAFTDGTQAEVNNYAELKTAIKTWRENNPDATREDRPTLVFPIEVITQEGETVTVASEIELRQLRRDCKRANHGHGKACFRLVYPVSVVFPDGTIQSFNRPKDMAKALREWKRENPNATSHPTLQYPVTVTLEDGTTKTVNSKEEMRALKADCK